MINVFPPNRADAGWAVWIDVEEMQQDGVCLGVGKSRDEALRDAKKTLRAELKHIAYLQKVPFEKSTGSYD